MDEEFISLPFGDAEQDAQLAIEQQTESNYRRYSKQEKERLYDGMLEQKYRYKRTWEETAAQYTVARSAIGDWRRSEAWQLCEAKWRRVLREEARSDAAMLGQDALSVLSELMHSAKSEFVRYSSASKLVDIIGIGDELEEHRVDQASQLNEFLAKMQQSKHRREAMADVAEVDNTKILELEVQPGGVLPPEITRMNDALVKRREDEQNALEAEFRSMEEPAE